MQNLPIRLLRAIEKSSYKNSFRKLSREADLSTNFVSNLLNKENDTRVGPGFYSICRLCEVLGITPNYLAGLEEPRISAAPQSPEDLLVLRTLEAAHSMTVSGNSTPTIDSLMKLFALSGGRIEAFSSVIDYCDLYFEPKEDDEHLRVKEMGKNSLSSLTLGCRDTDVLQAALKNVEDSEFKALLMNDYKRASKDGVLLSSEELAVQMPNKPRRIKIDYTRLLLKLRNAQGETSILTFARLL